MKLNASSASSTYRPACGGRPAASEPSSRLQEPSSPPFRPSRIGFEGNLCREGRLRSRRDRPDGVRTYADARDASSGSGKFPPRCFFELLDYEVRLYQETCQHAESAVVRLRIFVSRRRRCLQRALEPVLNPGAHLTEIGRDKARGAVMPKPFLVLRHSGEAPRWQISPHR